MVAETSANGRKRFRMEVKGYRARLIRGSWHSVVDWVDDHGRRHQKTRKSDAADELSAKQDAMEFYFMCKSGMVPMERRDGSLSSYSEGYFKGRLDRREYERSTYATNMKHIRAWERALGDVPLRSITEADIKDAISMWFSDGRDATTVDKRITALQEVCRSAVLDGVCMRNPFDNIRRPKKGWRELNGVNDQETLASVSKTIASLPLDGMKVAFTLAMHTGMRRGEIAGLQWRNVSLDAGVIWVRNAIGADDIGKYPKPPKSNKPRDIAMTPSLQALLMAWKEKTAAEPWHYVCGGETYMNPDYMTHSFTALARFNGWKGAAGRRLTLHDLRHTAANVLITSGADVKTVQSVLGHSSAATTLDMYASADRNAKRSAAELLGAALR